MARAERRGLRNLRSSARAGRCGAGGPAAGTAAPGGASGGEPPASAGADAAEPAGGATAKAEPGISGVKDEFRSGGPAADPATLLPARRATPQSRRS